MANKELELFSHELFNYIWQNYRFGSKSLNKAYKDMLKHEEQHPGESETISQFDSVIGATVLCTQRLLREFCFSSFNCYSEDLLNQERFNNCVYKILGVWSECRTNVFLKVLDSAAIVAETFLYCDAILKMKLNLKDAPNIFLTFLHQKELNTPFLQEAGWKLLRQRAFDDFLYLKRNLKPYISLIDFQVHSRLDYNCEQIKILENSPTLFPVENSKFGPECEVPSKCYIRATFYFRKALVKSTKEDSGKESSKDDLPQQEESSKDDSQQELPKCDITDLSEENEITKVFCYRLWGHEMDAILAEDIAKSTKAEKTSKTKKRKSKAISGSSKADQAKTSS